MANMIARLGVLLGLDTAQFNQGLAQSENKIEQFTSKAKTRVAALVAAFAAMTAKAMIFADEVSDVAKANDVAIDTVIKLQNALANSGGKAEDAGKIFSAFTNYVDKAAEGSLEAHKNFTKLGVSFKDLETLSGEQLFLKTINAIAQIEDPLTRSAKAMEVFGKAAKGVDIAGLADDMKNGSDVTERQANAIKLLAEFYDKLGQASRSLTLNFVDFLEPALKRINEQLAVMSDHAKSGTLIRGFFSTLRRDFAQMQVEGAQEEIALMNRLIADPEVSEFWKGGYRDRLAAAQDQLKKYQPILAGINGELKQMREGREAGGGRGFINPAFALANEPSAGGARVRDIKKPIDPEEEKRRREAEAALQKKMQAWANSMRRYEAEQQALDQQEVSYARIVGSLVDYDNAQKRLMDTEEALFVLENQRKEMKQYDYEFARSRIQLLAEQEQAQQRLNETELLPADREAAQQRLNEIYQRRLDLLKQIRDVAVAADADVGAWQGFKDAASDFFKNMPKDMETGAMMFQSVMGNMNQALDNFVRTGKLNFKDFARSIILDLIAIQLKASAMKLLSTLFGFNIPGKAAGGTVSGGSAYVVGERGPELFVPRMSGTIIPNHALSNVGAGGGSVTNNYINAIDVKSFEQRLMGSNKAIWAATQYAQKGLAVTPGRG